MVKLLVTGGAGYLGAALVKLLQARGHTVTAFDNLSTGNRATLAHDDLVIGDLRDRKAVVDVLRTRRIEAVMHLASTLDADAAARNPSACYSNNVLATHTLLDAMIDQRVLGLVYASSTSVYGMPVRVPLDEDHPKTPFEPFGATKWMCEQMLEHWRNAHGLQSVALRWFGTAGADPQGMRGPGRAHDMQLISRIMRAASGRGDPVPVHGNDYATRDGTCVRDFVHLQDVCEAHALALDALCANRARPAYNIGTGRGHSIRELILAAERITDRPIPTRNAPRRLGEAPVLVTDAAAARRELGWKPRSSDIDSIIRHAWRWEQQRAELGEFQYATISANGHVQYAA